MTAFAILTGKSLKSAIANYGKTAATFAEKTHQLAYSALMHVENHHDAIYCTAIYTATPKNYRLAIVRWMTAFGKVAFDPTKLEFSYSKGKKSDLPAALAVSPAEFEKAKRADDKPAKSLLEKLETMMQNVFDSDDASDQDRDVASAVNRVLASFRKSMPKAAPAASNVVEMKPAEQPAASSEAKPEAPKAAKPKVAKAPKAPKAAKAPAENGFTAEPREEQPNVGASIYREPIAA